MRDPGTARDDSMTAGRAFLAQSGPLLLAFLAFCALAALRMMSLRLMKSEGAIPWDLWFFSSFGRSVVRFAPVLVLVVAVVQRVRRPVWQAPAIAAAVLVGCGIGWLMTIWLEVGINPVAAFAASWTSWLHWGGPTMMVNLCALAGLGAAVYVFHVRSIEAEYAAQREEIRRIDLERQMGEARLQVMEAQIEPHFLFNSLANVQRLYQTDPSAGRAMLRQLSRYLSAALPRMRETDATLGRELELTTAYLSVQQIRMGRRLAFDIDVPDALKAAPIPPMMLTTLAENAIRHGLAPLPEGGYLRISAQAEGGTLRLQVADTGRGFEAHAGAGVGLANIRARLQGHYGASARLALTRNSPRGVTATVVLPWGGETNATTPSNLPTMA